MKTHLFVSEETQIMMTTIMLYKDKLINPSYASSLYLYQKMSLKAK